MTLDEKLIKRCENIITRIKANKNDIDATNKILDMQERAVFVALILEQTALESKEFEKLSKGDAIKRLTSDITAAYNELKPCMEKFDKLTLFLIMMSKIKEIMDTDNILNEMGEYMRKRLLE